MALRLASVEECASLTRLSPFTIRLWARQGKFLWYKLGSRMVIDQADFERFITERRRGRHGVEAGVA